MLGPAASEAPQNLLGLGGAQAQKGDLSDERYERWALIEPVIVSWKARHPSVSGHQGGYEMREIGYYITHCALTHTPMATGPTGGRGGE